MAEYLQISVTKHRENDDSPANRMGDVADWQIYGS